MKGKRVLERDAMQKILHAFEKYKYILIVVFAGIVLLLIPTFGDTEDEQNSAAGAAAVFLEPVSVTELEGRMEEALSEIEGAGAVCVVLALKTGTEQVLARDTESSRSTDGSAAEQDSKSAAVIVTRGSGMEDTVVVQQVYPEYRGAMVVCEGADNALVQLRIMEAVSALTGLGTDKISISKMKER